MQTAAHRLLATSHCRLRVLKYTIINSSTPVVVGSLTSFDLIFVLTAGGTGTPS